MKTLASYWVLQEIFIDPESAGNYHECTLNIKHSTSLRREENNLFKVVVEFEGSLMDGDEKVVHIQFVNVTKVEKKGKTSEKRIKKVITDKALNELLSILPMYLIKAGIAIKELKSEV